MKSSNHNGGDPFGRFEAMLSRVIARPDEDDVRNTRRRQPNGSSHNNNHNNSSKKQSNSSSHRNSNSNNNSNHRNFHHSSKNQVPLRRSRGRSVSPRSHRPIDTPVVPMYSQDDSSVVTSSITSTPFQDEARCHPSVMGRLYDTLQHARTSLPVVRASGGVQDKAIRELKAMNADLKAQTKALRKERDFVLRNSQPILDQAAAPSRSATVSPAPPSATTAATQPTGNHRSAKPQEVAAAAMVMVETVVDADAQEASMATTTTADSVGSPRPPSAVVASLQAPSGTLPQPQPPQQQQQVPPPVNTIDPTKPLPRYSHGAHEALMKRCETAEQRNQYLESENEQLKEEATMFVKLTSVSASSNVSHNGSHSSNGSSRNSNSNSNRHNKPHGSPRRVVEATPSNVANSTHNSSNTSGNVSALQKEIDTLRKRLASESELKLHYQSEMTQLTRAMDVTTTTTTGGGHGRKPTTDDGTSSETPSDEGQATIARGIRDQLRHANLRIVALQADQRRLAADHVATVRQLQLEQQRQASEAAAILQEVQQDQQEKNAAHRQLLAARDAQVEELEGKCATYGYELAQWKSSATSSVGGGMASSSKKEPTTKDMGAVADGAIPLTVTTTTTPSLSSDADMGALRARLDSTQQELDATRADLADHKKSLSALLENGTGLVTQLEQAKHAIQCLQKELHESAQSHEEEVAILENTVQIVQAEENGKDAILEGLERTIRELRTELQSYQDDPNAQVAMLKRHKERVHERSRIDGGGGGDMFSEILDDESSVGRPVAADSTSHWAKATLLQAEVDRLKLELQKERDESERIRAAAKEMEKENKTMSKDDDNNERTTGEETETKAQLEQEKTKNEEQTQKIEALQSELRKLHETLTKRDMEIETARVALNEREKGSLVSESAESEVSEPGSRKEVTVSVLARQLLSQDRLVSELREELGKVCSAPSRSSELQKEVTALRTQVEDLKTQLALEQQRQPAGEFETQKNRSFATATTDASEDDMKELSFGSVSPIKRNDLRANLRHRESDLRQGLASMRGGASAGSGEEFSDQLIEELEGEIAHLKNALIERDQQIQELEDNAAGQNSRDIFGQGPLVDEFDDEVGSLQSQLAKSKAQLADSTLFAEIEASKIKDLQNEISDLKESIAVHKDELVMLRKKAERADAASEDIAKAKNDAYEAKREVITCKRSLGALTDEKVTLERKLETEQFNQQQIRKEFEETLAKERQSKILAVKSIELKLHKSDKTLAKLKAASSPISEEEASKLRNEINSIRNEMSDNKRNF